MNKVKALTWATTVLTAGAAFVVLFGLGYGDLHHFDPLEIVSIFVGTISAGFLTYRMVTNDLAAASLAARVAVIEKIIIEHGQWRLGRRETTGNQTTNE
jgi:hypothetical protein